MEKKAIFIGIIGGLGLGLLIGSEFYGRNITILGAILVIVSIVSIAYFSIKDNK